MHQSDCKAYTGRVLRSSSERYIFAFDIINIYHQYSYVFLPDKLLNFDETFNKSRSVELHIILCLLKQGINPLTFERDFMFQNAYLVKKGSVTSESVGQRILASTENILLCPLHARRSATDASR